VGPGITSLAVITFFGFQTPQWLTGRWDNLVTRINRDFEIIATCQKVSSTCTAPALRFLELAREGKGLNGRALVGTLNRTVNLTIMSKTDCEVYGHTYWASPLEMTERMAGNCVGMAVLKATLAMLDGVSTEKLRFAFVLGAGEDQPGHVVLLYDDDVDGWLVMDSSTLFQKRRAQYAGIWAEVVIRSGP
jgi:predicted transglutaminase-like cysteine proteinase